VQPVFDTIAAAAVKLCEAGGSNVFTFDGRMLHLAAINAVRAEHAELIRKNFPRPPDDRGFAVSRAVMTRKVVVIPDVLADPDYVNRDFGLWGFRSVLSVPLMRDGVPIGAIGVGRPESGPFPQNQITLMQTFADQAVIAIENVRLFKELDARNRELSEALEQQTATSEILRVLSRSPTDAQPVFDAIAAAALKLCEANSANVFTFDGELLHLVAISGTSPEGMEAIRQFWPRPLDGGTAASRAVMSHSVVAIPDTHLDPKYAVPTLVRWGFRSVLGIPLMRDNKSVGAIAVGRSAAGPFPEKQIALLQTFADQAVIAIENVRLFKELEARTTELTQSVGELQALGEVGQAVSSTLDLETVLSTIVSRATELAGMDGGSIYEYEEAGEEFRLHTAHNLPGELIEALRSRPVPKGEGAIGRLADSGEPVAIRDIMDEGTYQSQVREILLRHGYRSLLAVPLLRENRLLGGLVVNRKSAGEFAPRVIELLKTFATQSALAIQNAQLFREIEDKSRQLEIASRQKSAFLANMSHELRTPLNAIIGFTRIVMRRSQEQLEPKQIENLEKILTSGQQLLALINTILDLAKVEAGRVDVNPAEIQPALLLEQCMRTVEPLVKEPVTLVKGFDGELPLMHVDEEMLRQIILNLLSNAAKFTASGNIHVSAEANDATVQIAVADTGIGIAADKLESIFEEFEQADASSTRVHGGTGLGLTIARRLARLMGGDISVESAPSVGSTFTLNLPVRYQRPRA
jgi:signal transduction histidine kinase